MSTANYKFNLRLTIAYDGTAYHGWQKTQAGLSIEETLRHTLQRIFQHPIYLQAASRTDGGVHAEEQIVNFYTTQQLDLGRLYISLNKLLPKDIAVLACEEAPYDFHPTLDAKGKIYHYYICNSRYQLPYLRHHSWHCYYPIDLTLVQEAAKLLVGTHNFRAFCNQNNEHPKANYERHVESIEVALLSQQRLRFEIKGHSFLYQMVRNLVGTLVYVGRGKITIDQIPFILNSQDRCLAGISAPAHGLFLHRVLY